MQVAYLDTELVWTCFIIYVLTYTYIAQLFQAITTRHDSSWY